MRLEHRKKGGKKVWKLNERGTKGGMRGVVRSRSVPTRKGEFGRCLSLLFSRVNGYVCI